MAAVDDAILLELASDRQRELFPALERGGAVTPLVALLAILPGLYALANDAIDARDARWGLTSLKLLSAADLESFLQGGGPVGESQNWQAPLGSWLTAAALSIPGLPPSIGIAVVSFLSTAGIVGAWYCLCERLAGGRFAFWATLMLAVHGPLLALVQSPGPAAPAILLALCASWGFFAHSEGAESVVSVKLLLAGIALGLCLLAGGPLAVVTLVVLGLPAVASRTAYVEQRNGRRGRRLFQPGRWAPLRSLALLAVTALAVGGWWVLMMAVRHGSEFWLLWSGFDELTTIAAARDPATSTWKSVSLAAGGMIELAGVLLGPALFGLWRAARELWWAKDAARRNYPAFLVIWLVCALPLWCGSMFASAAGTEMWRMFLLLPLVGLAAFAVEEIVERRVGALAAAWVVAAAIVIPRWAAALETSEMGELARAVRDAAPRTAWTVAGFALLSAWLVGFARRRDRRQRVCLIGLLLLLTLVGAVRGLRSVRLTADKRQSRDSLNEFCDSLAAAGEVDAQILTTDPAAPPVVEFAMRSVRPRLPLETARSLGQGIDWGAEVIGESNRTVLLVDWRSVDGPSPTTIGRKLQLERRSAPLTLYGRRLAAYRLSARDGAR